MSAKAVRLGTQNAHIPQPQPRMTAGLSIRNKVLRIAPSRATHLCWIICNNLTFALRMAVVSNWIVLDARALVK